MHVARGKHFENIITFWDARHTPRIPSFLLHKKTSRFGSAGIRGRCLAVFRKDYEDCFSQIWYQPFFSFHKLILLTRLLVLLWSCKETTGLKDATLQRPGIESANLQVCRLKQVHLVFRSLNWLWMCLHILFNGVHVSWTTGENKASFSPEATT